MHSLRCCTKSPLKESDVLQSTPFRHLGALEMTANWPPEGSNTPFMLKECRREGWPRLPRILSPLCRRWRKPPLRQVTDPSPPQRGDGSDRVALWGCVNAQCGLATLPVRLFQRALKGLGRSANVQCIQHGGDFPWMLLREVRIVTMCEPLSGAVTLGQTI